MIIPANPCEIKIPLEIADHKFFTIREFAQIIRVSKETVHNWHRLGHLEFTQFSPGRFFVPRAELDRYIAGKMMEPREQQAESV